MQTAVVINARDFDSYEVANQDDNELTFCIKEFRVRPSAI